MQESSTLGAEFAQALSVKDFGRVLELIHPEIDFRGMTPNRIWEAGAAADVISNVLREWFEEGDDIESLERLESESFADCERVGYRFRLSNAKGSFVVEQQAYLSARDGRIGWMRVLCSGRRPATAPDRDVS